MMCLPLDTIKQYLHYYAGRFQNNRFEHDELVNEAWIRIHDLTIPEFASAGIRWAMIGYCNRQRMQDHRGLPVSKICSIDDKVIEGVFLKDNLFAPKNKQSQISEDKEYAQHLLDIGRLTLAERLLIDQRYFRGLKIKTIAKLYSCAIHTIHNRLKKIAVKLKCAA